MSTQQSSRDSGVTTTTTTEGYYWERRRAGVLPWVLGAAGLLGLGLLHDIPVRTSIEGDLEGRAQAALAQAGASGVSVDFTGRDGALTGTLPAGVDAQDLVTTIEGLDGVRVVTADFGGAGSASGAEGTPSASPSPTESPAEPSAAASTPAAGASASVSVAATSGAGAPSVTATATGGKVTLTGSMPSQEAIDALVASATSVYGSGNVVNQLTVDEAVSSTGLTEFGTLVAAMGKDAAATAALNAGRLTLSGSVPSAAVKKAVEDAAGTVTGDATKVTSQLTVGAGASGGGASADKRSAQTRLNTLPQITFQTGSAALTPAGRRAVNQAAAALKANTSIKVRIEGHTDDIGSAAINQRLSRDRARTVRQTLRTLGIADDRMSFIGYGESRPKVSNNSAANRLANRRVQFLVL
jgi:OOP family OmpA-OmpF porin